MEIFYGKIILPIKVFPNLTVSGLKIFLQRKRKFNLSDHQFKVMDSQYSLNPYRKLSDCRLTENARLSIQLETAQSYMIEKQNRGLNALELGVNFINFNKEVRIFFNHETPDYRTLGRGLNLEGKCQNESCIASYNKIKQKSKFICFFYK